MEFLGSYDVNQELAREYDVQVMPGPFVIDRDGNIVDRHRGFDTSKAAEYETMIVAAIQSGRNQQGPKR